MTVESPRSGAREVAPGAAPSVPVRRSSHSRRLAGLDGLRAVAILAVLAFHLDPRWLPGGFLGVDVFFVISGFLITTLLVQENDRSGRVDLRGFWTRRARRLLPALLVLVPACVLLARIVSADLLVGIARQSLGALTFSSNWLEIAAGSDYFDATAPQLFMNLWSLAVEEQFYLVWPLATLALLRVLPGGRARATLVAGLALLSAALMAVRFDPELPTRVYYGTDTHAMGLMTGAAIAFAYAAPHRAWTSTRVWAAWRTQIVATALVVLGLALWFLDEHNPWTFRGGILLASLASAVLALAAVSSPGRLRRVLDLPALRWVGERSYGLYLWHWPVILIVGQDVPAASGGGAAYLWTRAWCVLVTVAVADLSYRFVELPVRRHGFGGATRRALWWLRHAGTRTVRALAAVAAVVALALAVVLVTAPERSHTADVLARNQQELTQPRQSAALAAKATVGMWTMPAGREVDVIGDSMVVGSLHALRYYFPGVRIDARSNRRWAEGISVVTRRADTNRRAVVVALGTNAGTDADDVRRMLDALGPQRMVVLVDLHGRFSRMDADNAALREAVVGRPNVAIARWDAAAAATPGSLQSDGIHPSLRGAHVYAKTIRAALAEVSERTTGKKVVLTDLPMP